jgi:hypothetical protein
VARRLAKCPVCGALQETQNTHKRLEDNLDRLEILHEVRKPSNPTLDLSLAVGMEREGKDAKVRPMVKQQEEESHSKEASREQEEAKSSTDPPETTSKPRKPTSCCTLQ